MDPTALMDLIIQYKYVVLLPATLAWGLLVCMIVGVLIRLGYLALIPAYICVMLGELIGDMIWYWIGYRWGETFVKRFGKYVGLDESHIAIAKNLFQKHDRKILLSSKLTTGFGFAIPILFTAGMTRMSFWSYMWANLTGQFFWSGGLIAIGYFFGDLYLKVNSVFEKATIISLFAIALLCFFGFVRYLHRRITTAER